MQKTSRMMMLDTLKDAEDIAIDFKESVFDEEDRFRIRIKDIKKWT